MEAHEANEILEKYEEAHKESDKTKIQGSILIAVLALLLTVFHLGGVHSGQKNTDMSFAASDAFAFYQAKNVRQTSYKIAIEELKIQLDNEKLSKTERAHIEDVIKGFNEQVLKYETEDTNGESKRDLLSKAKASEEERDIYSLKDSWFSFSESMLQIAIVITSVALIINAPVLMLVSVGVGLIGMIFGINGFVLLF
jgi:hypothetical protein